MFEFQRVPHMVHCRTLVLDFGVRDSAGFHAVRRRILADWSNGHRFPRKIWKA